MSLTTAELIDKIIETMEETAYLDAAVIVMSERGMTNFRAKLKSLIENHDA